MLHYKKLIYLGTAVLLIPVHIAVYLALVLQLALILIPGMVDAQAVKGALQKQLENEGLSLEATEIELGRARVDILPTPSLTLSRLEVHVPEKALFQTAQLTIYPELRSLLTEDVKLRAAHLESPHILFRAPLAGENNSSQERASLQSILKDLPEMELTLRRGELYLFGDNVLVLEGIQGEMHNFERLNLSLQARSNFSQELFLQMQSDRDRLQLQGEMRAKKLRLQRLLPYLPREVSSRVASSDITAQTRFNLLENSEYEAEIRLEPSSLRLKSDTGAHSFRVERGRFSLSGDKHGRSDLRMREVKLSSPQMDISGDLELAPEDFGIRLDLEGREVSISSLEEACRNLFPAGPACEPVFGIVREGDLPRISLQASGADTEALQSDLRLMGSLQGGKISLPEPEMQLRDVQGEFHFEEHRLLLEQLSASHNRSRISEGRASWDFSREYPPFHLELGFYLDLEDADRILSRVLDYPGLTRQMEKVENLKGDVRGSFSLTRDSLQAYSWSMDISRLDLQGRHAYLALPVRLQGENISGTEKGLRFEALRAELGSSSIRSLTGEVNLEPPYQAQINGEEIDVEAGEIFDLAQSLSSPDFLGKVDQLEALSGKAGLESLSLSGQLFHPQEWEYLVLGGHLDLAAELKPLPETLAIEADGLSVSTERASWSDLQLSSSRSRLELEGETTYDEGGIRSFCSSVEAVVRSEALLDILYSRLDVHRGLRVQHPVSVRQGQVEWSAEEGITLQTEFDLAQEVSGSVDLAMEGEQVNLQSLRLSHGERSAYLSGSWRYPRLDLDFRGEISLEKMQAVLRHPGKLRGNIAGEFKTQISTAPLRLLSLDGDLLARSLSLPEYITALDWELNEAHLRGRPQGVAIDRLRATLQGKPFRLAGSIDITDTENIVDLDMQARDLDLTWMEEVQDGLEPSPQEEEFGPLAITGQVGLKVNSFSILNFQVSPVIGEVRLERNKAQLLIRRAGLCHLDLRGDWVFWGESPSYRFEASASEQDLGELVTCLAEREDIISGSYCLGTEAEAQGKTTAALLEGNQGSFEFEARDGRIYHLTSLARIFALLNATEIFFGQLPDLREEGFGYNTINISGSIEGQNLRVREAFVDGTSMNIAFRGTVGFPDMALDLHVLVSPLKTVDRIISWIPGIRYILDYTLVSVPFRVSGDADSPRVIPLDPSAVGSEVLGIMQRTLTLPFQVLQPLVPEQEEEEEEEQ